MKVDSGMTAFWRGHWSAWQASGLSQRAYCEEHGLSYAAFGYWRKRVKPVVQALPGFVPVMPEQPALSDSGLELRLCEGRTIVIREGFDEALLARLIRTLERC